MSVHIRLLGPRDIDVFDNVDPDVFDGPIERELALEFLQDPRHHIAVALDARGMMIGMASGVHYVHPDKPAELFVNEVGVAKAWRNRGLGRRLLNELLDSGAQIGCRAAWVATEPDNAAARALYRNAGGTEAPDSIVMYTFSLTDRATSRR